MKYLSRELKNHRFSFDPDKREFTIQERDVEGMWGNHITIRFVQMFSLVRFFVSVCQKSFWRKRL
jgi:hypothetical protein